MQCGTLMVISDNWQRTLWRTNFDMKLARSPWLAYSITIARYPGSTNTSCRRHQLLVIWHVLDREADAYAVGLR